MVLDFLVEAFGGPAFYNGPDMTTAYQGLGISGSDWEVFERHAVAVLDKLEVHGKEREEFLAAAASLKCEIVENE